MKKVKTLIYSLNVLYWAIIILYISMNYRAIGGWEGSMLTHPLVFFVISIIGLFAITVHLAKQLQPGVVKSRQRRDV